MRLHRNLCFTVIDSLMAIFNEGAYADKVVAIALKKDKRWGSKDRKLYRHFAFQYFRLGQLISHEQAANIIGSHFNNVGDKLLNILQLKQLANN